MPEPPPQERSLAARRGASASGAALLDRSVPSPERADLGWASRESNWLPAPEGQFFMLLRTYLPADDIVYQWWQPPQIAAVR